MTLNNIRKQILLPFATGVLMVLASACGGGGSGSSVTDNSDAIDNNSSIPNNSNDPVSHETIIGGKA